MKTFRSLATVTLLSNLAMVQATTANCLYCYQQDASSGWGQSFSYCEQTDQCLEDEWNYINRECEGKGWVLGRDLGIGQCNPKEVSCSGYYSSPDKYGTYDNRTSVMLQSGEFCKLDIDATNGLARVIFEGYWPVDGLGIVEYPNYFQGDILTFQAGDNTLTLYNAAKMGSVTFDISFSGASAMLLGVSGAFAALSLF